MSNRTLFFPWFVIGSDRDSREPVVGVMPFLISKENSSVCSLVLRIFDVLFRTKHFIG